MKKIVVLISLLFYFFCAYSQKLKPLNLPKYDVVKLHFGMALGFNRTDALIVNSDQFLSVDSIFSVEAQAMPGFNINIVVNYNINKYWGVRFLPGLNFGQRNMNYIVYDGSVFYEKIMQIESTYLDFPLLLQLKSERINNYRAYIIAGLSYKYDLAAQKKIDEKDKPKIRFTSNIINYEIGLGNDFFLQYFKFAIEAKYVFGINNMLVYDNTQYTNSIKKINNQMFFVSLLFEGSDTDGLAFMKWFKRK